MLSPTWFHKTVPSSLSLIKTKDHKSKTCVLDLQSFLVIKIFGAETRSSWHLTWCVFCNLCFIAFYLVQYVVSWIFTSIEIRSTVSLKLKDMFKSKLSRFVVLCGNLLITQSQYIKNKTFFIEVSGEICGYSVARKKFLKDKWRCCRRKVEIWQKKNTYGKKLHANKQ